MRSFPVLLAVVGFSTSVGAVSDGEHLAYVVGCINCHHQRTGRDLPKISSIMGIVAVEQFSHMSDAEVEAIYAFLTGEWTQARASKEEAKIGSLYAGEKDRGKPPHN